MRSCLSLKRRRKTNTCHECDITEASPVHYVLEAFSSQDESMSILIVQVAPSVVSLPVMALYSLQAIKTPPQSRRIYGSGSPWHWLIAQLYDLDIFRRLSDHPVWLSINRETGTAMYSHDTTPHHLAVKLSEKNASKVTQNAARRT